MLHEYNEGQAMQLYDVPEVFWLTLFSSQRLKSLIERLINSGSGINATNKVLPC
jgi:hypothetical protein